MHQHRFAARVHGQRVARAHRARFASVEGHSKNGAGGGIVGFLAVRRESHALDGLLGNSNPFDEPAGAHGRHSDLESRRAAEREDNQIGTAERDGRLGLVGGFEEWSGVPAGLDQQQALAGAGRSWGHQPAVREWNDAAHPLVKRTGDALRNSAGDGEAEDVHGAVHLIHVEAAIGRRVDIPGRGSRSEKKRLARAAVAGDGGDAVQTAGHDIDDHRAAVARDRDREAGAHHSAQFEAWRELAGLIRGQVERIQVRVAARQRPAIEGDLLAVREDAHRAAHFVLHQRGRERHQAAGIRPEAVELDLVLGIDAEDDQAAIGQGLGIGRRVEDLARFAAEQRHAVDAVRRVPDAIEVDAAAVGGPGNGVHQTGIAGVGQHGPVAGLGLHHRDLGDAVYQRGECDQAPVRRDARRDGHAGAA